MTVTEPIGRVDKAALDALTAGFRGDLIQAGDPSYEDARRVYNAAVDRRPALVPGRSTSLTSELPCASESTRT